MNDASKLLLGILVILLLISWNNAKNAEKYEATPCDSWHSSCTETGCVYSPNPQCNSTECKNKKDCLIYYDNWKRACHVDPKGSNCTPTFLNRPYV